jgi:hypothetical protein
VLTLRRFFPIALCVGKLRRGWIAFLLQRQFTLVSNTCRTSYETGIQCDAAVFGRVNFA